MMQASQHLGIFRGQENLLPALRMLTNPDHLLDLVVVKDFIVDSDLLASFDDHDGHLKDWNRRRLYEVAPSLHDADAFVQATWKEVGYQGTTVGGITLEEVIYNDKYGFHLDGGPAETYIPAIVQGSLCLSGLRLFGAERLDGEFRTPDGRYDPKAYVSFWSQWKSSSTRKRDIEEVRSRQELLPGDLALFLQFPYAAAHGVKDLVTPSTARLLSWRAKKN